MASNAAPPGQDNRVENAPTPFPHPTSARKHADLSPARAEPREKIAGADTKIAVSITKIACADEKMESARAKMEIAGAKSASIWKTMEALRAVRSQEAFKRELATQSRLAVYAIAAERPFQPQQRGGRKLAPRTEPASALARTSNNAAGTSHRPKFLLTLACKSTGWEYNTIG